MKVVIFAGGVGTRLWPLSRKHTPKQFEKIIGDRSTLQETIFRLLPAFSPKDIYLATGKRYNEVVRQQLPEIPKENFIFEPEMRDVGPAIGLVASILAKQFPFEPVAMLWSDHLVKHTEMFINVLKHAEALIKQEKSDFVFIGQKPRFANQNIGWIEVADKIGAIDGADVFSFKQLRYRPEMADAERFFTSEKFVWNLGYFVTTPKYLFTLFKRFAPDMFERLNTIANDFGTPSYEGTLTSLYPTLEKINFDNAILEKMTDEKISVISSDLGWSDIGAWEALKEALSETEADNVTKGNVLLENAKDCLVFNYGEQLIVGIDLEELLVVNTGDVVLVCPKKSASKIKQLVESLAGTPNEHLT